MNRVYPSPSLSSAPPRPASASGVANFVSKHAARQRQASPWASTGQLGVKKEQPFSAAAAAAEDTPPPSGQPSRLPPRVEQDESDDEYLDEKDHPDRVSATPPGDDSDRTGRIFDPEDTALFSDSTVTISQQEKLQGMKMAVPSLEAKGHNWAKRGASEESVIELETKPYVFDARKEDDGASEHGADYLDDELDDEDFGSDGFRHDGLDQDLNSEVKLEEPMSQGQYGLDGYERRHSEKGTGLFGERHNDDQHGSGQQQQKQQGSPGRFFDGSSTSLSTTDNWHHVPVEDDILPPQPNSKAKAKHAAPPPPAPFFSPRQQSNGSCSPPPRSRHMLPFRRPASPRFQQPQLPVQQPRPLAQPRVVRKTSTSKTGLHAPPLPPQEPMRPPTAFQHAGRFEQQQHADFEDLPPLPSSPPPRRELNIRSTPAPVPMADDFKPLLDNDALLKIDSYPALLTTLANVHASSRAPSLPLAQLESELAALANHAYPTRDAARPRDFFSKLSDKDYEAAGEFIGKRKRELEDRLVEAAGKRRRMTAEIVKGVEEVAKVRVERLHKTEDKREALKLKIEGLLRNGGLDV